MLLETKFVDLKQVIRDDVIFYAHLNKEENKETLEAHTFLCQKYFSRLVQEKKVQSSLAYMIQTLFEEMTQEGRELFEAMFYNVVTFHDVGKCNPAFQSKKMKNPVLKQIKGLEGLGSNHSILSATIYFDYFCTSLEKIKKAIPKGEAAKLRHLLFLNAYIIAKHHSNLGEFNQFLEGFLEDSNGGICDAVDILEEAQGQLFLTPLQIKGKTVSRECKCVRKRINTLTGEEARVCYIYERLLYSFLVASDYYATSEFSDGVAMESFGNSKDIEQFYEVYQENEIVKKIRFYEKEVYGRTEDFTEEPDINVLRNELFLDAEKEWEKQREKSIFYLEAPTGSGKSNTAFNLGFRLSKENGLGKLFYVYPLNTLVEQNWSTLQHIFQEREDLLAEIAVINSITPIYHKGKEQQEEIEDREQEEDYKKALLNRQFLNYPMILTTNVSLFSTMFGVKQEHVFGFHQLMNSVIILDEIQNYKIGIWTEIVAFFQTFARMLHMKVIIMSATLPNLNQLLTGNLEATNLIRDRKKFYENPRFCNRVELDFHLLEEKGIEDVLFSHVVEQSKKKKKILIEFIKKKTAAAFYRRLMGAYHDGVITTEIQFMSGDDNAVERARILAMTKEARIEKCGMILVGTQVVEAGVDIDMDIGYKDISKLDSEEQFLGRINRSCFKKGRVYFFNLDKMQQIYKEDYRVNQELTLLSDEMKEILYQKSFQEYYKQILGALKKRNKAGNDENVELFFCHTVGYLNFPAVQKRMQLIEEDSWSMPVFLARTLKDSEGNQIDGVLLWEKYKQTLMDDKMSYAKKKIKLSEIISKMNYFIYQIKLGSDFAYQEQIGEIYYVQDGGQFFEDEKLCREKLENCGGMFLD